MKQITDPEYIEKCKTLFQPQNFFSFDIFPFIHVVEFDTNEFLLVDGETPKYLYYLFEGSAKLYLTHSNGKISLINFTNAPCFLGEMELIGAQESANCVKAITKCVCYAIEIKTIKQQLMQDSVFLRYLCHFLATKAINNTSNYSKNQTYPLENRLAEFILQTSHNGIYTKKHTEASEFLGVTYRHFLYVLADFVKQDILVKTSSGYKILSHEKLVELSKI